MAATNDLSWLLQELYTHGEGVSRRWADSRLPPSTCQLKQLDISLFFQTNFQFHNFSQDNHSFLYIKRTQYQRQQFLQSLQRHCLKPTDTDTFAWLEQKYAWRAKHGDMHEGKERRFLQAARAPARRLASALYCYYKLIFLQPASDLHRSSFECTE